MSQKNNNKIIEKDYIISKLNYDENGFILKVGKLNIIKCLFA